MLHTPFHTQQFNNPIPIKRLTISLPTYVYDQLMQLPKGSVSQFVTESIQKKFMYTTKFENKIQKKESSCKKAIDEFLELSQKAPLPNISLPEIKKLMRKGLM